MQEKIPFLQAFSQIKPSPDLLFQLKGATVTEMTLERETQKLSMTLHTEEQLKSAEIEELRELLAERFSLAEVEIENKYKHALRKEPVLQEAAAVITGEPIRRKAVPIGKVKLDKKEVAVEGKVFLADVTETRRAGLFRAEFGLHDGTGSLLVNQFCERDTAELLRKKIKVGARLRVQGKLTPTRDNKDVVFAPDAIGALPEEAGREDTAPEKRVELHLHTRFSAMDALDDPKTLVKQAIKWGHKAVAITDHGVCHGFPLAADAAGDKIKILYGVEGYYVNDEEGRLAVRGEGDAALTDEIVCFDIETTGLNPQKDTITEIGAVVLRDGEVKERFQTFVDPERPLPAEISRLTGITDEMLAHAPKHKDALRDFLNFVAGRPLAAHNAEFDIGFIRRYCELDGLAFKPTYVDSLILARALLPNLNRHKLDTVAEALHLPEFQHHRASDDAATVAYMLVPFWKTLSEAGVTRFSEVNAKLTELAPKPNLSHRKPQHIILLAQNKKGLKNLYQLVSASNLTYFKRYPWILKSEIRRHREGLIVGSACEAGELFRAVVEGKSDEDLKRIASFYDYLEIQPICNNAFLIRNQTAADEEELRDYNRTVLRIGRELGKPVCATGDVHFKDPEQEDFRRVLLDVKNLDGADDPLPIYFKTTDEMLKEFAYLGEETAYEVVVKNPNAIADSVENIELLPKGKLFPPRLENSEEELNRMVWSRARELYGDDLPPLITDRLNVELSGILGKYDVVYMSAQKLVERSIANGYLVGSRGSVGSSLVAYMAGITEVNALPPHYRCPQCRHTEFITDGQYGCGADLPDKTCPVCGTPYLKDGFDIPFETFLGYGGGKVPDIDLNFSGEYQAQAHQHTIEMFGATQVFRAGTIGTVAEKTALGYVQKYFEKRSLELSQAEKKRLALGCVDVKRTTGQHPGGLVVVPDDMDVEDFCPVQHPADAEDVDIITTHFEYHSMEDNLLKLDELGHDDPTIVHMLGEMTGVDCRTIPLDDPDTMSIFTSSRVLGYENDEILGQTGAVAVPEFNTRFTRQMLVDTQPKDFNTLVRLSGFSHGTDVWAGNARELIKSGTAGVLDTVGCRDDIMLYLIRMGMHPKTSFKIMEAVRKGKVKGGKVAEWNDWVQEMKEHGVPDWYIGSLAMIGYLFPKAHAVAYVMMAFRIAWYKVHYPLEFYAAFFSIRAKAFDAEVCCTDLASVRKKITEIEKNKDASNVEKELLVTLEVCYEFFLRGFRFRPIDIYKSDATKFTIADEKSLLPPFATVHGLGEAAALDTVASRAGHTFVSVEDFANRCKKLSRTNIEQLRALGAFADMPETSQLSLF